MSVADAPAAIPTDPRFTYVDSLRGIAAVGVAFAHLVGAAEMRHPGVLGDFPLLADFGRYGVQIFFVLSGFVIAHSVSNYQMSWNFLGRFAARRSVRLDLPYWVLIAGEIGLLVISGMVAESFVRPIPSIEQVAANALYLQMFLGYEHILPIFWTLCYEIQFYLAFVIALVILHQIQMAPGLTGALGRRLAPLLLAVSFGVSLLIYVDVLPTIHTALFDDRWFQFALGVITYLYFRGRCSWHAVVLANAACIVFAFSFGETPYRVISLLVTSATSLCILAAARVDLLQRMLAGPTLQYLGRISYSIYLLHLPIGWRVVVVIRELTGAHYNALLATLALAAGMAASIVAAALLYRLVEQPAIRLSRRISLPRRAPNSA